MNSYELFTESLRANEDRAALVSGTGRDRRQLSFGQLEGNVDDVAEQLARSGLRPGDRVLLTVPVSIDTYTIMLALLKAGLVIMAIDPGHGARQIARILRAWPPAAIVSNKSILLFRFLVPELRHIPKRFVVGGRSSGAVELSMDRRADKQFDVADRSAADSALLTFTSGSTGEPKPVVRTHGFLRQQMAVLKPVANFRENDVDFVAMPMFVLFNLANGITSIIPACDMKHPGRANPRIILRQLQGECATRMVASPALLERLAGFCLKHDLRLRHMRSISTGGGPVSPALPKRLKLIAPGATVRMVYGSTEAEPIALVDDRQISLTDSRSMRSGAGLLVGRPVEGCEVRIIQNQVHAELGPYTEAAFADVCQADGEIGEITVRGKHVLAGYADAARNAETKIKVDGRTWHRTGDAGYFDASGRLWLVGRCAAAIRDRRGLLYPFQVEYALSGTPGVCRAALVARSGKRVLVLETSGREFRADCASAAECIAKHEIDSIITLRRIPMDKRHDAKVDLPALHLLLDGKWARARLTLVETISAVFRRIRSLYRAGISCCKSRESGSKVGV